jgi:hypothetical protein
MHQIAPVYFSNSKLVLMVPVFFVPVLMVPAFCVQDELLAELEEMEEEELNRQLLDVGGADVDNLPAVPTAEPAHKEPRAGSENSPFIRTIQCSIVFSFH